MQLRPLRDELDIQRVVALAASSSDEVASEKTIRSRQKTASEFFTVAYNATDELVGFINGTLTASEVVEDDHDPDGSILCIQSVVVDLAFRRQGIALKMLKQYVERVCNQHSQVGRIVLFAKFQLVELFVKAGFVVKGVRSIHDQIDRLQLEFDCVAARQIHFVQVDAFTHERFQGNPAMVVLLQPSVFHRKGAPEWMQQIAREKNLGATAFAAPRERSEYENVVEYDIKWFSPVAELTMCGHGTLSTAVALLERGEVLPTQIIRFYNRTNVLVCRYEVAENQQSCVIMDFPCKPLTELPSSTTPDLIAAALGIPRKSILDAKLALNDVIVRVNKSAFLALKPDYHRLAGIDTGFVVTTEASPDSLADFQSRFFAPRIGIDEDPVTGSAHCGLGPYWSSILNKSKLVGYQSTPTRGGFVEITLSGSRPGRVLLKCQGVVVAQGILISH